MGMDGPRMHEALFWNARKRADGKTEIVCELCPRRCVLKEGQVGACGVRQVHQGKLYAMTYGKPCAIHVDPVEKKPLFHFYPGEQILSIATIGCNLFCDFCQNWQISKERHLELLDEEEVPPKKVIALAKEAGCRLIAFTYTEPTIYYEYALDIAKLAKKARMECVIISNGYIMEAPLKMLVPFISAANIDLKGTPSFYRKRCKVPEDETIKKTIIALKDAGVHVEITTLIIPGENDSDEEIQKMAQWIADAVGKETPLHLSAFHPAYRMLGTAATPRATLLRARETARKHLDFVYVGNVPGAENDTRCPVCSKVVIARPQYRGESMLHDRKCSGCGHTISGRF